MRCLILDLMASSSESTFCTSWWRVSRTFFVQVCGRWDTTMELFRALRCMSWSGFLKCPPPPLQITNSHYIHWKLLSPCLPWRWIKTICVKSLVARTDRNCDFGLALKFQHTISWLRDFSRSSDNSFWNAANLINLKCHQGLLYKTNLNPL